MVASKITKAAKTVNVQAFIEMLSGAILLKAPEFKPNKKEYK